MPEFPSIEIRRSTPAEIRSLADEAGLSSISPEQTERWRTFEQVGFGRTSPGSFVASRDGVPVAALSLVRMDLRSGSFLWARGGPVWLAPHDQQLVDAVVEALKAYLHRECPWATHLRLNVPAATAMTVAPTGIIAYDTTVVVDTSVPDGTQSDDAIRDSILSRMKPRGRRDVRKAIRESDLECADETARGMADFSEYQAIMEQTAARDGFTPWSADVYRSMLKELGHDAVRLYAGRIDGVLAVWSIDVIVGDKAWHYYAAMADFARRRHATDRLLIHVLTDLAAAGVSEVDLMGVGSDLAPSLAGLTEFKTKYSKAGTVSVDPVRDVPLRSLAFRTGRTLARAGRAVRSAKGELRSHVSGRTGRIPVVPDPADPAGRTGGGAQPQAQAQAQAQPHAQTSVTASRVS